MSFDGRVARRFWPSTCAGRALSRWEDLVKVINNRLEGLFPISLHSQTTTSIRVDPQLSHWLQISGRTVVRARRAVSATRVPIVAKKLPQNIHCGCNCCL